MKVKNMKSNYGNNIPNQFIITDGVYTYFQSYDKIIVKKTYNGTSPYYIEMDINYWDYSKTTGKYRNIFLGEEIAETRRKIKKGIYILTDLN